MNQWRVDDDIPDFSPWLYATTNDDIPHISAPWFYATTNFSKNQDVLITGMLLFKPYHELSFNAPNGMENQHVLVLTGISWNPPNMAESCNATNLDMICCIAALAHPKSWLRNMMGWEKKTARKYFFKCGEMESSLLFNPDHLVANHRNQDKIEESWRDGRISREFCLKLMGLWSIHGKKKKTEGRRRKKGRKEGRKKL